MKPRRTRTETEIKLRVADLPAMLAKLKRLKARRIVDRTHESNTLCDTARNSLAAKGQLLRVRVNQPAPRAAQKGFGKHARAVLTFKGPARAVGRHTKRPAPRPHFKIKEEVELDLSAAGSDGWDAADRMERILRALDLRPVFQYEKFRTTYVLPGILTVKVEVDETPVGVYFELEGTETAIHRAARKLGYRRRDYITSTYGALYIDFCRAHGTSPGNMLFAATKKLR